MTEEITPGCPTPGKGNQRTKPLMLLLHPSGSTPKQMTGGLRAAVRPKEELDHLKSSQT